MSYIGSKPANKPVVASDLDPVIITGQTALGATPADTDEFIVSDAGVLKRMDYSHIKGGGAYTKLLETTVSSADEVIYNNTYITSTYRDYMIAVSDLDAENDSAHLRMRISTDNGSSYVDTSEYRYATRTFKSDNTTNSGSNSGDDKFVITPDTLDTLARENFNAFIHIFNPLSSSTNFTYYAHGSFSSSGNLACPFYSGGFWNNSSTTAINAIKFYMNPSGIDSAKLTLYGRLS